MNLGRHFELVCMVCTCADPAMCISHRHIPNSQLHLVRVHWTFPDCSLIFSSLPKTVWSPWLMMLKVFCCISSLIYMGSPLPFLKNDSCKRRVFRRHWQRPAVCLREKGRFLLICAISNKMWPGKSFFFSGKVQINHKGDIVNSSSV